MVVNLVHESMFSHLWVMMLNLRPKNRNRFSFLTQLVAVAGDVFFLGGGSYCV